MGLFSKDQRMYCENCGAQIARKDRMLYDGISCCPKCYPTLKQEQEAQAAVRRAGVAPVITERRNGMVHQYSLYHVTCAACGKTFECRSDDRPRRYEDYEGKRYCLACWEKKEKELTVPCKACGKPISRYERRVRGREGFCAECWVEELSQRREMFGAYEKMLLDALDAKGIPALGTDTLDLAPDGQPERYHAKEERNHEMIRLRETEYVIGAFRLRGGWFAIPASGSALRYIKPSADGKLMEFLAKSSSRTVLAAAAGTKEAYYLTEAGTVYSTDARMNEVQIFDPSERIREITEAHFTEEEMQKRVDEFLDGSIRAIDRYYYDTAAHAFFRVLADGNYYHGYDVSYPVLTKEEVLERLARRPDVIDAERLCGDGVIPLTEFVKRLPDAGNLQYQAPAEFGRGTEYL